MAHKETDYKGQDPSDPSRILRDEMAAKVAQQAELTSDEKLSAWRMSVYLGAGMDIAIADELALSGIDTHTVLDLADKGCPYELIPKILL